MADRKQGAG